MYIRGDAPMILFHDVRDFWDNGGSFLYPLHELAKERNLTRLISAALVDPHLLYILISKSAYMHFL